MLPRRSFLSRTPFTVKPLEKGSRRWLVAELDTYTAILVRRRDRRCVTCGTTRGLQCSHFHSRRHLATRFDLRNCNAMCPDCNRRHNVDRSPYTDFMLGRYGPEVVEELGALRDGLHKVTNEELLRTFERLKVMV